MGLLWGGGAIVLCPNIETYQLFFAFVLGGMCAGATAVNATHLPTVIAFILPASVPLAASFLDGSTTPRLVSGLMILIFASALSLTSFKAHRAFGELTRLQLAITRQGRDLSEAVERLHGEVSERQKVEASLHQAQKMEAIGHLTGGIAHDFNNLLQVAIGNLSMIGRLVDDHPRISRHVQAAERALQQGARLVSSLLAFSRRQALEIERVDVNTLLQEFRPILLRAIDDKIEFRTEYAQNLPACDLDPAHFQSAVLNFVINARDAMPEGGRLSISTGIRTLEKEDLVANPEASPGRFITVSVQDSGIGMTPEILDRVFEPFFTTKDVGKGSGLGLSQVYGFARQSRGDVRLHSKSGEGSCVTIFVPEATL